MTFGHRTLQGLRVSTASRESAELTARDPRHHRLMKVTIYHERFGRTEGLVRNFSRGGIGGKVEAELYPGDVIEIFREGLGRFEAEIRWVRGGHFGAALTGDVQFDITSLDNLSFDGGNWDNSVVKPLTHHVFDRYRPSTSTYRPGFHTQRRG